MLAPRIGITAGTAVTPHGPVDVLDRRHVDAVVAAGGTPVLLPVVGPEAADRLLDGVDGLLLAGGDAVVGDDDSPRADAPDDGDAFERALVQAAVERHLPLLGVGRGHRVLNVALGGTLARRAPQGFGPRVDAGAAGDDVVHVASGSLLASVVGATELVLDSEQPHPIGFTGAGLQVVATWADGRVAAVEGLGDLRALAVDWRPERRRGEPASLALFDWLAREAVAVPTPERPTATASAS